MTSLVYVYAVLDKPVLVDLAGVNGQPVRWISEPVSALAAAVSDVPADEFSEASLNDGMRNMAWLGPRAVAHQDVNARLDESAETMIPLAFGTVFRDDERVRNMLRARSRGLKQRLDAVRGAAEWVVALHLLQEPGRELVTLGSPTLRALQAQVASSSPGRAHLLRRQMVEVERTEARRLRDQAADETLRTLRESAADLYQEPLPAESLERPLMRASVLVQRDQEARFLDAVDRLQARFAAPTFRLVLTGPWPPYRFGGMETNTDDG